MVFTNPETKVGFVTLLAVMGMLGLFLWLNSSQIFQRGYTLEASFSRIEGLRPGATVKFAGVDVGRVSKVYFEKMNVIVRMRIKSDFQLPEKIKAQVTSAGVVGDMFVEIVMLRPGESFPKTTGNRIPGQNPVTMESFYASAYRILSSLEQIVDTIRSFTDNAEITGSLRDSLIRFNRITADIEKITGQLEQLDYLAIFNRLENTVAIAERIMNSNEKPVNDSIKNITTASSHLLQASVTANKFLENLDGKGQTAADLKQILTQAKQVAQGLEKVTSMLEEKGTVLMDSANQTMAAINQAAQNINRAVTELTSGETNSVSQVKKLIAETSVAVDKISQSVDNLTQTHTKSSLGLGYRSDESVTADFLVNFNLNSQNSLLVGVDDIGGGNSATLQWGFKGARGMSRTGLYRNQFGVGYDWNISSQFGLGIDLWDTDSVNFGLTAEWNFNSNWGLSLGGESNLMAPEASPAWKLQFWRNF
ncbi:MAG: MlaD family protein [Firmicutes bacterium]|nr:MlaD family protein [Bacillota bacterium]